jgi:hypothetical protein
MKVLNLQCGQAHGFEGWFGSEEDYQSQRARGLVSCPLCGDAQIVKLPSAPRLNLGAVAPTPSSAAAQPSSGGAAPTLAPVTLPTQAHSNEPAHLALQQMQAALMNAVRHVLAHTEDVGTQFADEARKMHYGEAQERGIRGQVTREETEALLDEGIEVLALPMLESLKGPLQ